MHKLKAKVWVPMVGVLAFLATNFKLMVMAIAAVTVLAIASILISVSVWVSIPLFASANVAGVDADRPLTRESAASTCNQVIDATPPGKHEGRFYESTDSKTATALKCSIQSYKNGSVTYDIAFLEFNDAGELREPAQLISLMNYINTSKALTSLVFVHGLRNDAAIGSGDVRRFHTMTSLTANYVAQRKATLHPDQKTLGIFIGWRGRLLDEGGLQTDTTAENDPRSYFKQFQDFVVEKAAPITILSRKPKSDAIAPKIANYILQIETAVKGKDGSHPNNHLLVYGHSLGGNILLKGLADTQITRIQQTPSGQAPRGIGDLVVLINPASQAANFSPLQLAVANQFTTTTTQAPLEGKAPVWVSLTAAKYFSEVTCKSKNWDTAVGEFFPLMQRVLTLDQASREETMSVGNLLPISQVVTTTKPPDASNTASMPYVVTTTATTGVSHEIEVDESANEKTTYAMAGHLTDTKPTCPSERSFMDWQKTAINVPKLSSGAPDPRAGREWNAAAPPKGNSNPDTRIKFIRPRPEASTPSEKTKTISINVLHGAARHQCRDSGSSEDAQEKCKAYAKLSGWEPSAAKTPNQSSKISIPVIGLAWDPVWNAAVHSNVIDEHSGYLSHSMWCVLNRFVLDKPPPSPPKTTAQQTQVTSTKEINPP